MGGLKPGAATVPLPGRAGDLALKMQAVQALQMMGVWVFLVDFSETKKGSERVRTSRRGLPRYVNLLMKDD